MWETVARGRDIWKSREYTWADWAVPSLKPNKTSEVLHLQFRYKSPRINHGTRERSLSDLGPLWTQLSTTSSVPVTGATLGSLDFKLLFLLLSLSPSVLLLKHFLRNNCMGCILILPSALPSFLSSETFPHDSAALISLSPPSFPAFDTTSSSVCLSRHKLLGVEIPFTSVLCSLCVV